MKTITIIKPLLLGASMLAATGCAKQGAADVMPTATPQKAAPSQTVQDSGMKAIADDLAANGQHAAAIPMYRHLASRTGDPDVRVALASSLSAQGAYGEALSVLRNMATVGQMNSDGYYAMGKALLALGRFDEALDTFRSARQFNEINPRVASGEAIALAALGRPSDAVTALSRSVAPRDLSNKALIHAVTGNTKAAVASLEPLVRAGMLGPQGRQNLAMAYLLDGREEEAYRIARLDLDPATINETFTFYRSLASLDPAMRMRALITGTIDPAWTREEAANLTLADNSTRQDAASRIVEDATMIAQAPPKPIPAEPEAEKLARASYELTEVPPLVEPEGWALQIGAYRTIKNLMRGWTILYRESGDILRDIPPRRSEVDFGARTEGPKGFYYRLNAGPLKTLEQARDLCRALTARGTSCWIRPPETTEGTLPARLDETPIQIPAQIPAQSPAQTASLG